jgi:hypothetical protein
MISVAGLRTISVNPVAWLKLKAERHTLKLSFLLAFGAFDYFGRYLQNFCTEKSWHLDQIYVAIFSFSAIEIGGLLALYTLLLAETPTTRRLGRTKSFRRYVGFVRTGIWISGATAVVSIPFLIVAPELGAPLTLTTLVTAIWYGLSVPMFFGLFRIMSVIQILVEPDWLREQED